MSAPECSERMRALVEAATNVFCNDAEESALLSAIAELEAERDNYKRLHMEEFAQWSRLSHILGCGGEVDERSDLVDAVDDLVSKETGEVQYGDTVYRWNAERREIEYRSLLDGMWLQSVQNNSHNWRTLPPELRAIVPPEHASDEWT